MAVGAVVLWVLGPALVKIGPILTEWVAKNGATVLDGMLKSPQRRTWRTYAAAAITGGAGNKNFRIDEMYGQARGGASGGDR